jgi:hypothetical protein
MRAEGCGTVPSLPLGRLADCARWLMELAGICFQRAPELVS